MSSSLRMSRLLRVFFGSSKYTLRSNAYPQTQTPFYIDNNVFQPRCLHLIRPYSVNVTKPLDVFQPRHIGPTDADVAAMLKFMGLSSMDELVEKTIPNDVLLKKDIGIPHIPSESALIERLKSIMSQNYVPRSLIGTGYVDCIVPPVIQRNILENPLWYTPYTPYQAEISQGRLQSLLNFQTMICDLTKLPVANASLLDEGTAAAEAMVVAYNHANEKSSIRRNVFLVDVSCHPQTIAVVKTRAHPLDIEIITGDFHKDPNLPNERVCGALVQYPSTDGQIKDYTTLFSKLHQMDALAIMATDILALTILRPPGEFDADIAIGTTQRFGIPMGFGGPHAAFFACQEFLKRRIPGRLVGVSRDAQGNPALRLSLQTREQHIRREKATSNICTAQVLLANMAAMYAIYHGPLGLKAIALRIHHLTVIMSAYLKSIGFNVLYQNVFDTIQLHEKDKRIISRMIMELQRTNYQLRTYNDNTISMTFDETTTEQDIICLATIFQRISKNPKLRLDLDGCYTPKNGIESQFIRKTPFLEHPTFNQYHSETEMLRYITHLQSKDISLAHTMIPLGSCTMKLNGTTEMLALSWPFVHRIHPFGTESNRGYEQLFKELKQDLATLTGMDGVSLQPNSGSQGEYAGLCTIRAYHESRNEGHRDICLIPMSAHGTNPASASLAGLKTVIVKCHSETGDIDHQDLQSKALQYKDRLACMMITYPSTFGFFDSGIKQVCDIIHQMGGQVYLDGANMNAQTLLCRPGDYGADVCHLNLHKTFCIPHGGGGPGMGPICVKSHLIDYLPENKKINATFSAAPNGSASLLTISWSFIRLMGVKGLKRATQVALLNANYMRHRLEPHYPIAYRNKNGMNAHEFILDLRPFNVKAGIEAVDVAKRLMDYGFHSPTMSWPVANTLMIEPTESESKAELDRYCDALIQIRREIEEIENGQYDRTDNVLKNAPHTMQVASATDWQHSYSREKAVYPMSYLREKKFWPSVSRVDDAYGDRHVICTCPPIEDVA